MKICVPQNEIISNLRYVRECDYVHSYTEWLDNGKQCKIIYNKNLQSQINNDNKSVITIYYKMDYKNIYEFFNILKNINKKFIIISGCSDYTITNELFNKKPSNVIKWYGENVETPNNNLISLPMGSLSASWIGNNIDYAELINHKDFPGLIKVNNEKSSIENLLFMCFSLETNYEHRNNVYKYLKDKQWVSNLCKEHTGKYLNDNLFINNCCKHHFIISPFGNGIDCGRTWLALQVGCIPILPYHTSFVDWVEQLPIILYKDLNDITEQFLLKKLEEFKNKNFNYNYLKTSYWKNRWETDKLESIK